MNPASSPCPGNGSILPPEPPPSLGFWHTLEEFPVGADAGSLAEPRLFLPWKLHFHLTATDGGISGLCMPSFPSEGLQPVIPHSPARPFCFSRCLLHTRVTNTNPRLWGPALRASRNNRCTKFGRCRGLHWSSSQIVLDFPRWPLRHGGISWKGGEMRSVSCPHLPFCTLC